MDNVWVRCFSYLFRKGPFKSQKNSSVLSIYCSLIFCSMQLFTIPVCSRRRRRFVNSAFPNKKHLAQKTKFIHDKQKLKPMFAEILRTKNATGKRRLTSSNRAAMSTLHAHWKNDTTNLFGFRYKLVVLTKNNKVLLFFSGTKTIQTFNDSVSAIMLLFATSG